MAQGFRVINPGILTLLQDLGRFGYQHLGLSPGGAADEHAYLWANRLLGNPANSPALEICFGGLELEADVATRVAITGANMQITLNGRPLAPWQTHNLGPGERLQFSYAQHGVRAYFAVQGGFQVEPTFGSVATVVREQLGGLDGRGSPISSGDFLPCAAGKPGLTQRVRSDFIPDYRRPLVLRVIAGDQRGLFPGEDLANFYAHEYRISNQSDRMGVRLSGTALAPKAGGIISEGTSFGTLQVPPDGQPIILLKDRQTIGGYPKLGTVFALDAFALSQRQPHTAVRFAPLALQDAQQMLGRFYGFFCV